VNLREIPLCTHSDSLRTASLRSPNNLLTPSLCNFRTCLTPHLQNRHDAMTLSKRQNKLIVNYFNRKRHSVTKKSILLETAEAEIRIYRHR
jgi:hypothetical protein